MRHMLLPVSLCMMGLVVGCAEPAPPVATTSDAPATDTEKPTKLETIDAGGLDEMITAGVSVVEFGAVW